jgi:phosphoribosyl 1,2-cyclic phosphodiesterase
MRLQVINSNSAGNAYILENDQEALLIECGVRFDRIKKALGFNLGKVAGCIVTHEHKDHCVAANDVIAAGIFLYASPGTHKAMGTRDNHYASAVLPGTECHIGRFRILPFDIQHDCEQPLGYLINHPETGTILFLTDSYYCKHKFTGLNHIIIEANYSQSILDDRVRSGSSIGSLRDRVIESHMSLDTCRETLLANNLSKVQNIVLIHLSDSNSNAKQFKREIESATGKVVYVAEAGLIIENFNKQPF